MIGIDAVDVERLRSVLQRSRGTEQRLFTPAERTYCRGMPDPVTHLAGTLAVKEAVIKAAGLGPLSVWGRRIEVCRDPSGAPRVEIAGRDEGRFEVSISHDGPIAVAIAFATPSSDPRPTRSRFRARATTPRPNPQLVRYLSPTTDDVWGTAALSDASVSFAGTDFP